MMKLFVFACLVAFAVAGEITYSAAPLPYAAAPFPYAYSAGYPYAGYGYPYETKRVEISDYKSPLSYTAKYTPPTVYSNLGYNAYTYGSPYLI